MRSRTWCAGLGGCLIVLSAIACRGAGEPGPDEPMAGRDAGGAAGEATAGGSFGGGGRAPMGGGGAFDGGSAGHVDEVSGAGGGGGSGGSESTPECEDDSDCDDGFACTGIERCVEGACVPQESVQCGEGMVCVEEAGGACEYIEPSPWILLAEVWPAETLEEYDARMLVVPVARAGIDEPIEITEGAFDDEFFLSWYPEWSPDGRYLAFDASNGFDDIGFESKIYLAEFGPGLPSKAFRVPDLPTSGGAIFVDDWSPDSSAFSCTQGNDIYLTRVTGGTTTTALAVRESGEVWGVDTCAGGESLVYFLEDSLAIVRWDGSDKALLRADAFGWTVSPDARWVVGFVGEDDFAPPESIFVTPCGPGELRNIPLSGAEQPAGWSPDSRYLLLNVEQRPTELLRIEDDVRVALPADSVDYLQWVGEPPQLSLVLESEEHVLFDPETGETTPLPAVANAEWFGNYLVDYRQDPDSEETTAVTVFAPLESDLPLFTLEVGDATLESVLMNGRHGQLAYLLLDETGTKIGVVDVNDPEAAKEYVLEDVAATPNLKALSGDGRALIATYEADQFELWVFPLNEEPFAPIVAFSAQYAEFVSIQPWRE